MTSQPTPAAIRELRRQGLTTADIARMFRVHPRAVAVTSKTKAPERFADN